MTEMQEVLCVIHGVFEVPADDWRWECPACEETKELEAIWRASQRRSYKPKPEMRAPVLLFVMLTTYCTAVAIGIWELIRWLS